jgi:hypothetical protein
MKVKILSITLRKYIYYKIPWEYYYNNHKLEKIGYYNIYETMLRAYINNPKSMTYGRSYILEKDFKP